MKSKQSKVRSDAKPILKPLKQKDQREKLEVKKSIAGLGLFATAPIKKGSFIIEYVGPLLNDDEVQKKGGKYLFALGKKWTIYGTNRGNIARYINHSCVRTNCEPVQYALRIKIKATRNIAPGEELFYDYGKEYFNEFIKGHCQCYKHSEKTRREIDARTAKTKKQPLK